MDIRDIFERDGRGYNQLARDSGLSPSMVWRVVNGKTWRPSPKTVTKLATVFGVGVDVIIKAIQAQSLAKCQ